MQRTKSALSDHVYELALDVIESENYDILNEGFLPEDVANAAANIFKNMLKSGKTGAWTFRREPFSLYTLGYSWKVSNSRPCYITCSDDGSTGVSRSEGCILGRIYGLDKEDVADLLHMMNEAWFLMKNA